MRSALEERALKLQVLRESSFTRCLLVMRENRQPDFSIELNDIGPEVLGSSHLAPPQLSEASPQNDDD